MKGERLGEFEELLLLTVLAMEEVPKSSPSSSTWKRSRPARFLQARSMPDWTAWRAIKGLVRSLSRGGESRSRRQAPVYLVTRDGLQTANYIRRVRRRGIWKVIEERR